MQIVPCKVIQESTIRLLIALQSGIQTAESKIQTSEESGILILGWAKFLESEIHDRSGIRNPSGGIRNPRSGIRNPKRGIRNPRSVIWKSKECMNPESKECMDYLIWANMSHAEYRKGMEDRYNYEH
jgi:hypothetical protein